MQQIMAVVRFVDNRNCLNNSSREIRQNNCPLPFSAESIFDSLRFHHIVFLIIELQKDILPVIIFLRINFINAT